MFYKDTFNKTLNAAANFDAIAFVKKPADIFLHKFFYFLFFVK
jgi:hypothetical protein